MIRDAADGLIRTVTEDSLRDAGYVVAGMREAARRRGRRTEFYGPVMVDFESLPSDAERACFKRIGTTLVLPEDQVDALREIGRRRLAAAPEFRRFVRAHRGEDRPLADLPAAARFCPQRHARPVAAAAE
jgi:hypothetical protein